MSSHPSLNVISIGAIHHDTIAHAETSIDPETSTPARFSSKPGGVATNIARTLVRLDVKTLLVGTVGEDAAADMLQRVLSGEGLDLRLVRRKGLSTGQYIAFHDPSGDLTAACVDDSILSKAPADLFDDVLKTLCAEKPGHTLWFLDANLPVDLLLRVTGLLTEHDENARLFANAVSNAKAHRLLPILDRLECLMLNRGEAAALLGTTLDTAIDTLASGLSRTGLQRFILTDGGNDVLLHENDGFQNFRPAAAQIVDVTGAGDALTAGTIAALARGYSYRDALPYGLSAAALTLQGTGALPVDLSWDAIQ
ncbi:MAG: carbohydrate kinase [Roseibium sp.]|uniref:PfkB family carbohydrate kinase n=1 Tax=Roseibium sp. TaxID=1936156 RepID=UPI001B2CD15A|nr:PfkB family carbohydrate kinase [Roseibium sp.]MBO6893341.1 carbohydrate kinase [Roseibium sp.]MBO6932290.1 carbohydrate kinase [Roseibium sp.]